MSKVLTIAAIGEKFTLSRSGIYERLNRNSPRFDPDFPRPIKLGARRIGFLESQADDYLRSRVEAAHTERSAS